MNTISKMQWFIDSYKNQSIQYKLANTHETFGTIVMPTGVGKSGLVYEDIIYTIDNLNTNKKIIINISCPILKLTQQFINDLVNVLIGIYLSNRNDLSFYINSSDNGNNYDELSKLDIDVDRFSNINKFFNNSKKKIAIVASCHKSMYKFVNAVKKWNNEHYVINYLDEAHLISLYDCARDEEGELDEIAQVDINKLCQYSNKVYAFSATPSGEITNAINKWRINTKDKYIIHTRPIEAINENIIVAPLVKYISCIEDEHITIKLLQFIMKDAIESNLNINHKILVTLSSSTQLFNTRIALEKLGYKVFSTCAKYGFGAKPNEDKEDGEITKFISDVDNYNGHCFVLHIRQLIQGIDIKSLTDCVIYNDGHGSMRHYRHTIQTIGRILRTLSGERGVAKEFRKKKVGNVYFITPAEKDEIKRNMENFICRYYGFDNITFEEAVFRNTIGMSNDDIFESFKPITYNVGKNSSDIVELMCNIEKYIEEKIKPFYEFQIKNGLKINNIQKEAIKVLKMYDAFGKEYNTDELLDNRDLLDDILKMFNKHGIQQELF